MERAMGIEPTTFSLGSCDLLNRINDFTEKRHPAALFQITTSGQRRRPSRRPAPAQLMLT